MPLWFCIGSTSYVQNRPTSGSRLGKQSAAGPEILDGDFAILRRRTTPASASVGASWLRTAFDSGKAICDQTTRADRTLRRYAECLRSRQRLEMVAINPVRPSSTSAFDLLPRPLVPDHGSSLPNGSLERDDTFLKNARAPENYFWARGRWTSWPRFHRTGTVGANRAWLWTIDRVSSRP